jgi:hypothetical protein
MSKAGSSTSTVQPVKCPECSRTKALQPGDTHKRCFRCLGADHDMSQCEHCHDYSSDARKSRAERLYVWRVWGGGTTKIPSTKQAIRWFQEQGSQSLELKKAAWKLNSEVLHRPRYDRFAPGEYSSHEEDEEGDERTDGDQDYNPGSQEEGHDDAHDGGAEAPQSDEIVGEIRDEPRAPDTPSFHFRQNPTLRASQEGREEGGGGMTGQRTPWRSTRGSRSWKRNWNGSRRT